MARARRFEGEHEVAVGRLVALMRRKPGRLPWKVIEARLGASEPVLRSAMRRASRVPVAAGGGFAPVRAVFVQPLVAECPGGKIQNFDFGVCLCAATRNTLPEILDATIASESMGGLLSGPDIPAPAAVPATPSREDPAVAEARARATRDASRVRGRRASLVTGGQGVSGDATVTKRRLFGA